MATKKTDSDRTNELLQSIRNLLILQLSASNVPVLSIVKAAKIRTNDIYKIIPKTKSTKKHTKKTIKKNSKITKSKK